jgi:hypothetical protein
MTAVGAHYHTGLGGDCCATPSGNPVDLIGRLTTFRRVRTIIIGEDGAFFGRREFDMGNVDYTSSPFCDAAPAAPYSL